MQTKWNESSPNEIQMGVRGSSNEIYRWGDSSPREGKWRKSSLKQENRIKEEREKKLDESSPKRKSKKWSESLKKIEQVH